MKFSVSNIAWTPEERLPAYAVMADAGMDALEIAPGLLFASEPEPISPSDAAVKLALGEIASAGLQLVSMQALLFGVQGAALFGTTQERACFDAAMLRAIQLAGRLEIGNLVFGSPKQRIVPPEMPFAEAHKIAAEAFARLGDAAQAVGTRIAIEPNPAEYGTNFLNTHAEALAFVEAVDHQGISGIIDTGAMAMNGEGFDQMGPQGIGRVGHVHLSAPHLGVAPPTQDSAQMILQGLRGLGYAGTVSIEMKRGQDGMLDLERCVARLMSAARDQA